MKMGRFDNIVLQPNFVLTISGYGSGRLDMYQKGGDSLDRKNYISSIMPELNPRQQNLKTWLPWNFFGLYRTGMISGSGIFFCIRNGEKEEIDFLLSNNHNPFLLIEANLSDDCAAKSLIKFQKILNIQAVQLVNKSGICKLVSNNILKIMIIRADHWLSLLP